MLKVGMARANITPPQGIELEGYPHYPRHNTGAHDPLNAACMYLDNGKEAVAMITLDLLFFSKQYVAKVRRMAEEKCGIKGANIMFSCSHTHSGPASSGFLDVEDLEKGRKVPEAYINDLITKLVDIIVTAKTTAVEGYFAYGTEICGAEQGVGGNRRMPGGPHDPLVSVMAIKDTNDVVRGVLVNYTLHPTFIHEWSTVCTADYPAYIKVQVEEVYKDALTGFSQGCSGNQSSRYYRQGESYDEAERVGRVIGKAALAVIEKANWMNDFEIKTASKEIEIETRSFGTEEELVKQVEHDTAVYKELYAKYGQSTNRDEYYLWQNANLKCLGSENQLGYVRIQNRGIDIPLLVEENPAEIQVFNIGGVAVVGFPGEAFVEYGLYIKAMAGFGMVVVNTVTNGCLPGYMYTPESIVTGGYETDTSMLAPGFGRKVVNTALEVAELVK